MAAHLSTRCKTRPVRRRCATARFSAGPRDGHTPSGVCVYNRDTHTVNIQPMQRGHAAWPAAWHAAWHAAWPAAWHAATTRPPHERQPWANRGGFLRRVRVVSGCPCRHVGSSRTRPVRLGLGGRSISAKRVSIRWYTRFYITLKRKSYKAGGKSAEGCFRTGSGSAATSPSPFAFPPPADVLQPY